MKNILMILAVMASSYLVAFGEQFYVYNPSQETIHGMASIPVSQIGKELDNSSEIKLINVATGAELPWQIIKQRDEEVLITGLKLEGLQTAAIRIDQGKPVHKSLIQLKDDSEYLSVYTPYYMMRLGKKNGYTMKSLRDLKVGITQKMGEGGILFVEDGEQPEFNGHLAKGQTSHRQSRAAVTCRVLYEGSLETEIELSWSFPGGKAVDTITFNGINRLVRHDLSFSHTRILAQAGFHLSMWGFSGRGCDGFVFPQQIRYPKECYPAPGYEFAYNAQRKFGVGLIAPTGQPLLRDFTWRFRGPKEGTTADANDLFLNTETLRYQTLPASNQFFFALFAGGDPQTASLYRNAADAFREFEVVTTASTMVAQIRLDKAALIGRKNELSVVLEPAGVEQTVAVQVNGEDVAATNWMPTVLGLNEVKVTVAGNSFLYHLEVRKPVTVDCVSPDKLLYESGSQTHTTVTLTSHSDQTETVTLNGTITSDLDSIRKVAGPAVVLKPFETRQIEIPWTCGKNERGITFTVTALCNGVEVDRSSEVVGIGEPVGSMGQYVVINPGNINNIGRATTQIDLMRENYIGTFEYYCWTPCPLTGLTPEGDSWMPHTESQRAYEATVEKQFVIDFVKYAHKQGLAVFPWMNGEVALPTGLDHPETYRYSDSGQPLLYNGRLYGDKRYAIAYTSALYDEEAAYKWGQEMAKSIDMFGWDGCRFDWGFTPSVVGDPMRAGNSEWYNYKGVPSREMYPDQTAAGTAFLKAFRRGVTEKHPKFRYGTNTGNWGAVGTDHEENAPLTQYGKEASTDSFLWFEYLLNYSNKKHGTHTWQGWAGKITRDAHAVRKNGATIGIGNMRPYPPGTVSHKFIPYILLYSGVKYIGGIDRHVSLGEGWKCWRHALRFDRYFFDPQSVLMPLERREKEFAVANAPHLYWKQWIFEQPLPNGRRVLVNMMNLPESEFISERHEVPATLTNVVLTVQKQLSERITRVAMLVPEPEPHVVTLTPVVKGDMVTITIPSIEWVTSVVIETEKIGTTE